MNRRLIFRLYFATDLVGWRHRGIKKSESSVLNLQNLHRCLVAPTGIEPVLHA